MRKVEVGALFSLRQPVHMDDCDILLEDCKNEERTRLVLFAIYVDVGRKKKWEYLEFWEYFHCINLAN